MAPALKETNERSSPTVPAYKGTLKAIVGGSQVNGKQDLTKDEERTATSTPEEPAADNATVPENAFETEHSKILFEAIDQLHSLGAGQLDIPQLVIVGSQSGGKSSLLRALTDIPFPVASGRCTRFPVRIVSKRTKPGTKNSYHVSIEQPSAEITGLTRAPIAALDYHESGENLTMEEFETIIKVAYKEMGIYPGRGQSSVNFVSNVLKVELSGPHRSQFSIIDLPGTYTSAYDTFEAEMAAIKAMTLHYMRQPENIVICVVDTAYDFSNQDIFTMSVQEVRSQRLVGVLTKCDRAHDQHKTVAFALGETAAVTELRMHNDWFVVGNLDRANSQPKSLENMPSMEDTLFMSDPWTRIKESRRGSEALRTYLADILSVRIRQTFPTLESTIKERLKSRREQQRALGDERETLAAQQQFLNRKAQSFRAQAKLALDRPGLSGDAAKELRQITKQYNDEYAFFMREFGHGNNFENTDINPASQVETLLAKKASNKSGDHTRSTYEEQRQPTIEKLGVYRGFNKVGSVIDLLSLIGEKLSTFQARQLPGVVNPDIYPVVYRQQTLKWTGISHVHLDRVSKAVWRCVEAIIDDVCPETEDTALLNDGFRDILRARFDATYENALEELAKYCKLETEPDLLQTADPKFAVSLDDLRKLRFYRSYDAYNKSCVEGAEMNNFLNLFSLMHSTMKQNMIHDVHDVLKTYYEVSIESFIRHITNIVVEGFLSNKEGPLFVLSTDFILSLPKEEVERLARENDKTVAMRQDISRDIEKLSQALAVAKQAREQTERLLVS